MPIEIVHYFSGKYEDLYRLLLNLPESSNLEAEKRKVKQIIRMQQVKSF